MSNRITYALTLAAAALALTGCRVDTHRNGSNNDDVKIATPFGGMSVKTDDSAIQANVGLATYPGATLEKKSDDHNNSGSADINMSFGNFHLGVKALSYETPDAPEKVIAFYRKDMARYGAVLFCKDDHAIGTPSETQDGLTCSDDQKHNIHVRSDTSSKEGELKAGSKQHQHIVSVESRGSGTKIGLVMLDLPGHLGSDDDSDSRQ